MSLVLSTILSLYFIQCSSVCVIFMVRFNYSAWKVFYYVLLPLKMRLNHLRMAIWRLFDLVFVWLWVYLLYMISLHIKLSITNFPEVFPDIYLCYNNRALLHKIKPQTLVTYNYKHLFLTYKCVSWLSLFFRL